MPQYTGHGARTNTVAGKNVVIRRMAKHYQALADMRPHIDNNEPESRIRVRNLKESIKRSQSKSPHRKRQKNSVNSPLGYKRAPKPKNTREKCMLAIKKIKNEKVQFNTVSPDSDLSEKLIERRKRREKMQQKEHQKTLDKIQNTISDLNNQSIHARKYNRFDPIAYPVTLFRRDSQNNQYMDCLSDSSKNLGKLVVVTDLETRTNLQRSYSARSLTNNRRYSSTSPNSAKRSHRRAASLHLSPSKPNKKTRRPQSAKRVKPMTYSRPRKSKRVRPLSAVNRNYQPRNYYQNRNHKPSVSFKFDDNEPMLIDSDNDDINISGKSVHPQTLQIKNRIMSQIIQHKIFSQNKLILFFKSTLQEYGEDDEIILSIIRDLCTEFHVPFQKVMVNTPDNASVTTLL